MRMKDEKVKPDVVVLCTGYRQEFPFLVLPMGNTGRSYPTPMNADVRNIWKRDDPSIGFIGFVRPSLGAIPPISEMQAQLWILNLVAPQYIPRQLLPHDEQHYKLNPPKNARVRYGVDHESYIYQLALDMDSAPGALEVVQIGWTQGSKDWWKLPLVWALGANFNTKFRLCGPWQWGGAVEILTNEFWVTIRRRRLFYGVTPHFINSIPQRARFTIRLILAAND